MKIWLTLVRGGKPAGQAYHQMAPACCKVLLLPGPTKLHHASTAAPAAPTQGVCFRKRRIQDLSGQRQCPACQGDLLLCDLTAEVSV